MATSNSSSSSVSQSILLFSILIFIFFLVITIISSIQYSKYNIVDGTTICEEFFNRCLLVFTYKDKDNVEKTKVTPIAFSEINQSGVFSVQVAYTLSNDDKKELDDYFVIGSPYHVFLGNKSMLLIYVTLTFLALLICASFIPNMSSSSSHRGK